MFPGRDGRDPERSKDSRRPLPYWIEELGAPRTGSEDSDRQLAVHHSGSGTGQRVGGCPGQI